MRNGVKVNILMASILYFVKQCKDKSEYFKMTQVFFFAVHIYTLFLWFDFYTNEDFTKNSKIMGDESVYGVYSSRGLAFPLPYTRSAPFW